MLRVSLAIVDLLVLYHRCTANSRNGSRWETLPIQQVRLASVRLSLPARSTKHAGPSGQSRAARFHRDSHDSGRNEPGPRLTRLHSSTVELSVSPAEDRC